MSRFSLRAFPLFAALVSLSLLEGAGVLIRDLLPQADLAALPVLEHAAITLGSFGLIAAGFAAVERVRNPLQKSALFAGPIKLAAAAGLALFAIPACLSAIASRYIPPLSVAALATLTLLFTTIFGPYLASDLVPSTRSKPSGLAEPGTEPRYGILPSLLAFAGVLLIFPVFVPSSWPAALGFAAALLSAVSLGAGNCLLARAAVESDSLAMAASAASLPAALLLAMLSFLLEAPRLHRAMLNLPTALLFVAELLALALLFRLARRLSAPALATRAAWSLLFPILVEAVALSFPISTRNWIGLALMASGSAWLLLPTNGSSDSARFTLR